MTLRFQFDSTQQYQVDAIRAITDIFEGQQKRATALGVIKGGEGVGALPGIEQSENGIGNWISLPEDQLLRNVRAIQARNGIADATSAASLESGTVDDPIIDEQRECPQFTVEMETGTGKTYVYVRTVMELAQRYGYRKFVIVVPSIAVREGTLKSLSQLKEHLSELYDVPINYFVYGAKNLGRLREFAASDAVQVMVINIQAFAKDAGADEEAGGDTDEKGRTSGNVIYRPSDALSGRRPIDYVHAARPIVIIDEPQSVDGTPRARTAIERLNPLCILRYSATHRDRYNLMYVLDPIRAFELRLVKQIRVDEVRGADEGNEAMVRLEGVDRKNGVIAKVRINVRTGDGVKEKVVRIGKGDDLHDKSAGLPVYAQGFVVSEINADPDNALVAFSGGMSLTLGEQVGGVREEIWQAQIDRTVESHFEKVRVNAERGIPVKVLSLFFIDKVANYRVDPERPDDQGKFAVAFEAAFRRYASMAKYRDLRLAALPVAKVHDGYFSQDKKGYKDTRGETALDEDTYSLIMRDKERLLSPEEPLQFIFSHSALREGWDNPNVFQICTLNETQSAAKKRQEIGRGLRVPVDHSGKRVFDDSLNQLTVIANESYEDFARKLQTEYEEDAGVVFGKITIEQIAHRIVSADGGDRAMAPERAKELAREIHGQLLRIKVLGPGGVVAPAFDPDRARADLVMPVGLEPMAGAIVDLCVTSRIQHHVKRKRDQISNPLKKEVVASPEFEKLWNLIRPRTTYSLNFSSDDFVDEVVYRIKTMGEIPPPKVSTRTAILSVRRRGIESTEMTSTAQEIDMRTRPLQDVLTYLQSEVDLTRSTLLRILQESQSLEKVFVNPQVYLDRVTHILQDELGKLLMSGIKYERLVGPDGEMLWEMDLFPSDQLVDKDSAVQVKKSIYDYVVYDSDIERKFALDLDKMAEIRLFVKLPAGFKVDTPVGRYNPDWAIVKQNGEALYLIRETKGSTNLDKLQYPQEKTKCLCGKAHFEELGVSYRVVVEASDI